MKKYMLKRKRFRTFLAAVLLISSFSVIPALEVHGEKGEGTVYAKRTFDSNYDSQNAYDGDDLGCTYTPEKTTFKVWSPLATSVVLCRYREGNGNNVIEEVPMKKGNKGVWSVTVTGDIVNTYYTYKVTVNGTTKEAVDIYAKAAGVNGDRAMVVNLDCTDPEHWDKNYQREKTLLSDIIVWEVHVRDFSIDVSSGVSQENRGKYKAFTESTTVNGEGRVASCVNYLKELGVTHVQILPMYDYASVDETNVSSSLGSNYNWGYDPKNYNVPEGSYSSNPYDGNVRIREMKEMIQALHDAGIKVIMDVVYNHTYDTADSNFNKIMPDYYYKINSDLSYNNQSGCGNATRSESAMFRKFMIDSVSYWAEEYNLDGFRFDLMGIHDVNTMNQIRSTLDNKFGKDTIVLYGEGWTGDGNYDSNSAHKANEANLDKGIGYFNDQIRDALKGEHKFDGTIGLVQTNYFSGGYLEPGEKWPNNVFGGIMGSVGKTPGQWGMWRPFWSKSSNCCLSYVSAHDNLTLWDKLAEGFGKNFSSTDDKMKRMNKMAGSVVLVSKGGVFMQAGEEFARTKNGDDNSYASSDSVNKIDWNRVSTYSDIQKYYKGMISIRKAFSGFRSITERSSDNWNPTNNNLTWISKDEKGLIGFYETNNVSGEWDRIAVLINNAATDTTVNLTGSNNWVIIADGTTAGLKQLRESGSNVTVPGKSVMVAVPKGTFDQNQISENRPPVITCDSSFNIPAGESLSFTVGVSDPDGDAVTLTAKGVPEAASFNTSTGVFLWETPVAGEYTLELTATDKKDITTKVVNITVVEKTSALKVLIKEIEQKNYQKKDFTETVWKPFENAFGTAKAVVERNETDESQIQTAWNGLNKTHEGIKKEALAREGLVSTLNTAGTRLADAKQDLKNYDAEAVDDLETVISETTNFINSVHVDKEYDSAKEDLEAAIKACASLKANPVIRVKADGWRSPAVYVWKGEGENPTKFAGEWPGTNLTTKDAEGWYMYELPEGTTGYSLIVNDGVQGTGTQTDDITNITGSVDITVTSFTGSTCIFNKQEHEVGSGRVEIDKNVLGSQIIRAEQVIRDNPNSVGLPALQSSLKNAKSVWKDTSATQVEINQSVRGLKKSIRVVEENEPAPGIDIKIVFADESAEYVYDGNQKEPDISVKDGTRSLTQGIDYQVGYRNNVNAGDKNSQTAPTALVTGIGSYAGKFTESLTFTIQPKALTNSNVTITGTYTYTGNEIIPTVRVADGEKTLVKDKDYEITYGNNKNAGTATVNVTGIANYTGAVQKDFTIEKAEIPAGAPETEMAVAAGPLNGVNLNSGWELSVSDRNREIGNRETIEVTVVYNGADKDNYNTITVTVKVTGIDCKHEDVSKHQIVNAKDPTCTEDGYSGDTICINCQMKIATGKTLTALGGHTGGTATCISKAVCERCGEEYGSLNFENHAHTVMEGKIEANCQRTGYTGDKKCTDCNSVVEEGKPVPKTEHAWDAGKVTKAATAIEDGVRTYTCTVCGTKKTEKIPKTGESTTEQGGANVPVESLKVGSSTIDPFSKAVYRVTKATATVKQAELVLSSFSVRTVTIPDQIVLKGGTYQVTAIADNAFKNNRTVQTVKMGNNIKTIGKNAFYGCSNLKKVTFSKNTTTINSRAFYKCTKLTSITIPDNVSKIGSKAFYGCKKLKKITIKTSKLTSKRVGSQAFKGITAKATIKVPKKKLAAYKKLLKAKGVSSKTKIK